MEIKTMQINKMLLFLNCVYFIKSVGATLHNNFEFDYAKGKASSNRNMEGNGAPKYEINMFMSGKQENSLTENKNQIELKKEFLINDTMHELEEKLDSLINGNMNKLGVKINTLNQLMLKIDPLINDKMEQMKDNITMNIFNLLEPKIDSVINDTVFQLEGKINSLNSLMLNMNPLLSDKMKQMEENISINIFNRLETKVEKLENKIKLIDHNLKDLKCYNNNTPRGCHYLKGCDSGIYSILNFQVSNKSFLASCDLKTLGGGWTIIQRRQDGSETFFRTWNDYVEGFGDVKGEFFIGLEKLFALTSLQDPQELYIMMEDFDGVKRYARYGEFKIDSESTAYKLTVGLYSGDAGDNFSSHNGQKFSTRDRDNDNYDGSCAEYYKGCWWYNKCFNSNLNGLYLRKNENNQVGISWGKVNGSEYLLKFVQMMIRPKEN